MKFEVLRLNLCAPLCFVRDDAQPFDHAEGSGEKLFCFELNEDEYLRFEPNAEALLGNLIFAAKAQVATGADATPDSNAADGEKLPAGDYLFAQKREVLSRADIIDMAAEIQQEGLWQRLEPGRRLYLRYLFEDGRAVTQLFRPCNG